MAPAELLHIQPGELKFPFELKKQIYCSIRLINKKNDSVAFKVKTTSPKKYCVRPNTGIISPDGSCDVVVTMQAQSEAPPDMQCKDKFLVQSVVVPTGFSVEDFTNDMFNKESGNAVFEEKLKVQYIQPAQPPPILESAKEYLSPRSPQENGDRSFSPNEPVSNEEGELKAALTEARAAVAKLTKEKNAALQRTQQLQKEVESLALKITEKGSSETIRVVQTGFSFLFVLLIGILGVILGYLLRS